MIFVVFALLFASSQAFLFGEKVEPDWDALSVTFPNYHSMPMTEDEVVRDGWKKNGDGCVGEKGYKGHRYVYQDDMSLMLLFDHNGRVAGVQMGMPNTFKIPTKYDAAHLKEGDKYILTAYFTDPQTICSGKRATKAGYVGDKLFLVMNNGPVEIPLQESGIDAARPAQQWTKGKCFIGMGQHYWYNIRKDMDCNEFAPFFLLYNGGKLNGFGFADFGNLKSPTRRIEYPPQRAIKMFFYEKPVCIEQRPHLSTLHVYMQRRPYLNFC